MHERKGAKVAIAHVRRGREDRQRTLESRIRLRGRALHRHDHAKRELRDAPEMDTRRVDEEHRRIFVVTARGGEVALPHRHGSHAIREHAALVSRCS